MALPDQPIVFGKAYFFGSGQRHGIYMPTGGTAAGRAAILAANARAGLIYLDNNGARMYFNGESGSFNVTAASISWYFKKTNDTSGSIGANTGAGTSYFWPDGTSADDNPLSMRTAY